jgi:5'-nucleotidase
LRRTRLSLAAALALATSVGVVATPSVALAAPGSNAPINVQLIAMNDFHGRIELTAGADSEQITAPGPDGAYGTADDVKTTVGGAANVASTVARLQSDFLSKANGQKAGSFFVGAGDLVSASPFASSVFKDEPTIEVLDALGLDVSSVGNHEFDRGTDELRRISAATDGTFSDNVTACPKTLGGEPFVVGTDGCFGEGEHAFDGADFPYLAANVVSESGEPMLPPYQVFDVDRGKKVALIGVVTETTPGIVAPDGIADVSFIDEAEAVNKYVPELRRQGVEAIGVLIHEGGQQNGPAGADPNGCNNLSGPIVDINNRISNAVDLIVSAHTHAAYNCKLAVPGGQDRLVTSAGFYGRLLSDIRLTLDGKTGDVDRQKSYTATNVPVARTNPDAGVQSIVDYWVGRSKAAGDRIVGKAAVDITNAASAGRPFEQPIGNLVAEAQLEGMQEEQFGFPTIAFMNPGGVRTNILAGDVTYAELFNVQPFGNTVNTITLTGADIDDVLEQQYQQDPDLVAPNTTTGDPGSNGPLDAGPRGTRLTLGTNEGFTWSYDLTKPYGDRVPDDSIKLDGATIVSTASYRVVANSFLVGGGDTFTAFTKGTAPTTGPVDVDLLVEYFETRLQRNEAVSPPPANHGTQIG